MGYPGLPNWLTNSLVSLGVLVGVIADHEALYQALKDAGASALLGVTETRMASQLYSTAGQSVYSADLSDPEGNEFLSNGKQPNKKRIRGSQVIESKWNEFAVLTSVLHPILGFLRYCDGNNPSLLDSALAYASAEMSSMRAADEAAATFPDLYAAIPFETSGRN